MALFTPSAVISEIRGSVGTAVFSRNHYRNIVRNRVTPANPNTSFQMDVRANMATAVAAWQALSAAVQTKFETAAKNYNTHAGIDNAKALNGYNFYLKTKITSLQYGITAPTGVFIPRKMPIVRINSINVFDVAYEIDFDLIGSNSNMRTIWKCNRPVSPGIRSVNQSAMVPISTYQPDIGNNLIDLNGEFELRFVDTIDVYIGSAIFTDVHILDTTNCILYPAQRFRNIITV